MQDLRLAIRALRATPIVTAVATLSLALGIGANTAIFSLVNGLLLRHLPVADPQHLAIVSGGIPTYALVPQLPGYTAGIWTAIHDQGAVFDDSCAWAPSRFDLARGGEIQPTDGLFASGDFFKTLGVPALLGRTFTAEDDLRGRDPVAVISYGFWQRRFGGAPDVIGTPLIVERVPFTIVGVTPPEFFGAEVGRGFDVAVPIQAASVIGRANMLDAWIFRIMVRLKAGQSVDMATATLRRLQPQIREAGAPQAAAYPDVDILRSPLTLVSAPSGTSALRRRYQRPLSILQGVVALVLLVACANIATVLLARATARRHELAIQRALGASAWRLGRQWLVESLLLSAVGAAVGVLFAQWGTRWLTAHLSTPVTQVVLDASPDWHIVAFTATATLTTALLFGIAPAFRAARAAPMHALQEYGRVPSLGALGTMLVTAQIALSLVLVTSAMLMCLGLGECPSLRRRSCTRDRRGPLTPIVGGGSNAVLRCGGGRGVPRVAGLTSGSE
jgi:putative ABC transport system permease protein